jgi:hypothetical protein
VYTATRAACLVIAKTVAFAGSVPIDPGRRRLALSRKRAGA